MEWHTSSLRLRLAPLISKAVCLCLLFGGLLASTQGRAEEPFADSKDIVPVQGNPTKEPRYIENAIKAVSIVGWGGPFRLDSYVGDEPPSGSIYLERTAVHLHEDPLADSSISLNIVFRSPDLAKAMVARMERLGAYTYYVGPGGYIYPTLISETTAPALCATLRNAEQSIIIEARRLLSSPSFARIRAAQAAGKGLIVRINGRLIQYEPGAPCSGMTLFGENGFLLGREAFKSESEVVKTLLHELHRLTTSVVRSEGATVATVHSETQAAKLFADRAFKAVLEGGGR